MELGELIRAARLSFGLTQVKLAQLSGISLPFVQLIETGKANPSIETLNLIMASIGYRIQWEPEKADWSKLAAHGLPLMDLSQASASVRSRSGETLVTQMRLAAQELIGLEHLTGEAQRKREALEAMLLALRTHFPKFFRFHFARAPIFRSFLREPDGRLIKLSREARAVIATYL